MRSGARRRSKRSPNVDAEPLAPAFPCIHGVQQADPKDGPSDYTGCKGKNFSSELLRRKKAVLTVPPPTRPGSVPAKPQDATVHKAKARKGKMTGEFFHVPPPLIAAPYRGPPPGSEFLARCSATPSRVVEPSSESNAAFVEAAAVPVAAGWGALRHARLPPVFDGGGGGDGSGREEGGWEGGSEHAGAAAHWGDSLLPSPQQTGESHATGPRGRWHDLPPHLRLPPAVCSALDVCLSAGVLRPDEPDDDAVDSLRRLGPDLSCLLLSGMEEHAPDASRAIEEAAAQLGAPPAAARVAQQGYASSYAPPPQETPYASQYTYEPHAPAAAQPPSFLPPPPPGRFGNGRAGGGGGGGGSNGAHRPLAPADDGARSSFGGASHHAPHAATPLFQSAAPPGPPPPPPPPPQQQQQQPAAAQYAQQQQPQQFYPQQPQQSQALTANPWSSGHSPAQPGSHFASPPPPPPPPPAYPTPMYGGSQGGGGGGASAREAALAQQVAALTAEVERLHLIVASQQVRLEQAARGAGAVASSAAHQPLYAPPLGAPGSGVSYEQRGGNSWMG